MRYDCLHLVTEYKAVTSVLWRINLVSSENILKFTMFSINLWLMYIDLVCRIHIFTSSFYMFNTRASNVSCLKRLIFSVFWLKKQYLLPWISEKPFFVNTPTQTILLYTRAFCKAVHKHVEYFMQKIPKFQSISIIVSHRVQEISFQNQVQFPGVSVVIALRWHKTKY